MTASSAVAHRWRAGAVITRRVARVPRVVDTVVPADETATSCPARGILLGLALVAPFWTAVLMLVF